MTINEFRKRVRQIKEYWIPVFGLSDWKVALKFTERKDFATCFAQPEYEEAEIFINTKLLRNKSKDYILDTVVHELAHIRTWEAGGALDKLYPPKHDDPPKSELLTTAFARTALRAHKAGFEQALEELEEEDDVEE